MKGLLWKPSNVLLDRQTYLPPRFQSRCAICSAPTQSRPLVPHSSIPTFPKNSPSTSSNGRSLDVVALGNLCLDIMVPVETLPDAEVESRRALLKELTAATHDRNRWEVGGNSNFLITGARLGLAVSSIGDIGRDEYGNWISSILLGEGVKRIESMATESLIEDTLLCFVLVDGASGHAFCSRYDFGPHPLLPEVNHLAAPAEQMLREASAVFMNGFVLDELSVDLVLSAVRIAREAGTAVFFDPGPRCWTLLEQPRRHALDSLLDQSSVVLMTQEEAEAVTGQSDPEAAARWILARPGAATEWCVIKLGKDGAILCTSEGGPAFRQTALTVEVKDTVGCGDSFAAAIVAGYIRKHPIPALMALANAVGAATAMGSGAGRNVASAGQVTQLLTTAADEDTDAAGALKVLLSLNESETAAAA